MRETLLNAALTAGFAPIIVPQGLYVRHTTPELPEADGSRHGVCGQGAELRLLIVGDSAAAGVGVTDQQDALAGQLVDVLRHRFQVHWQLLAESGLTTAQIADRIATEAANSASQNFDIAIVSAGVNDVIGRTAANRWQSDLDTLCTHLRSHYSVQQILLTQIPPIEQFPALPFPLNRYLGRRAALLNAAMLAFCGTQQDCKIIQAELPLDSDFIASDGFHPGPAAYRLWAERAAALIMG